MSTTSPDHKSRHRETAFLFDVDGVLVEAPHEQCWKQAAVNWGVISETSEFTDFYVNYVAGEPGLLGARNILQILQSKDSLSYFDKLGINSESQKNVLSMQFRDVKQSLLTTSINNREFIVYGDILRIIYWMKKSKIPVGLVSSSENAKPILEKVDYVYLSSKFPQYIDIFPENAGLLDLFDICALGTITHWRGALIDKINHYAMAYGMLLHSMGPHNIPDVFVFEDSPKGISAVKKLGFHCIGVSRRTASPQPESHKMRLREAGCDLVYTEDELITMRFELLESAISDVVRGRSSPA